MTLDPALLLQAHPAPAHPLPSGVIGTGGIVADAHLPAYKKAGFQVAGLYDRDAAKASALAAMKLSGSSLRAKKNASPRGVDPTRWFTPSPSSAMINPP